MSGAQTTTREALSVKELQLIPGSEEAVKAGCICNKSNDTEMYLIHEHCPIHYHILMISNLGKMSDYMLRRDNEITAILCSLLIAVIITFGYFLFMVD